MYDLVTNRAADRIYGYPRCRSVVLSWRSLTSSEIGLNPVSDKKRSPSRLRRIRMNQGTRGPPGDTQNLVPRLKSSDDLIYIQSDGAEEWMGRGRDLNPRSRGDCEAISPQPPMLTKICRSFFRRVPTPPRPRLGARFASRYKTWSGIPRTRCHKEGGGQASPVEDRGRIHAGMDIPGRLRYPQSLV
jgi:hypothetical protein